MNIIPNILGGIYLTSVLYLIILMIITLVHSKTDKQFDVVNEERNNDPVIKKFNLNKFKFLIIHFIYGILFFLINVILFHEKILIDIIFSSIFFLIGIGFYFSKYIFESPLYKYESIDICPDKIILYKEQNLEKEIVLFNSIDKVNIKSKFFESNSLVFGKEMILINQNGEIITTILFSNFKNGKYLKQLIFEKLNIKEN